MAKSDIDERKKSPVSMMPEGLLTPLSDVEVRDLIAYLAGAESGAAAEVNAACGVAFVGQDSDPVKP